MNNQSRGYPIKTMVKYENDLKGILVIIVLIVSLKSTNYFLLMLKLS